MRYLLLLLMFTTLYGEQVEVKANHFEADEIQKVSYFKGNVEVKKGTDEIKSDTLQIIFDANNKPTQYIATGDVRFDITTEDQRFEGSSQKITYEPAAKRYTADGNVMINERTKNQTLTGEHIVIDRNSGKSTITGSHKKPVKFIFNVEE